MTNAQLMELAIAEQKKLVMATGGFGNTINPNDAQKTDTIGLSATLYGYSLEQPAKQLIPFLPAWVQSLPRQVMGTGLVAEYRRITGVSQTGKSTAAEGTRGAAVTLTTDKPTVSMGNLSSGLFDVTLEAQYAAGTFEDALARATTLSLLQARRSETAHILGGNVTALGSVGTPAAVDNSAVVGNCDGSAYYVYIKALTAMAMQKAILGQIVVVPAPTTYAVASLAAPTCDQTDGWGVESTVSNTITPTSTHSIGLSWTPSPKAAGYGIFVGRTTGIANAKLQCVVGSQANVVLTSLTTGGAAGVTGDNSADANDFPGLIALLNASGSGAYIKAVSAALTADNAGGITQINTMLTTCYLQQLGIDKGYLIVGMADRQAISRALGTGASSSNVRYVINLPEGQDATGGIFADFYKHPITGAKIPIITDPNLAHGMIIWVPTEIPYIAADVPSPLKMFLTFDWMLLPYAVTAPKREYEARMRGGLACYLPPAFGILYDIYFS